VAGSCGNTLATEIPSRKYLPSNNGGIGLGNTIGTLTLPPADPPAAFGTAI
jgi:hypothetical protein